MSKTVRNVILTAIPLIVLSLVILFGPGVEDKKDQSLLWQESWEKIEFIPAPRPQDKKSATEPGGKSPDTDTRRANTGAAKTMTADRAPLPITFIRRGGFFRDRFLVRSPRGCRPKAPAGEHRAGGIVKNIFSEWSAPQLKAAYSDLPPEKLKDFGLTGRTPQIRLYSSENSDPVIVRTGGKLKNGNLFLTTSLPDHEKLVFAIAAHIVERLQKECISYREKRILIYPTKSHTARITVEYPDGKKKIEIAQTRKEKKGRTVSEWRDGDGTLLPTGVAARFDNQCRQLQIRYFADDPAIPSDADGDRLWKETQKGEIKILVAIKGDGVRTIFIKKSPLAPEPGGRRLALIRNDLDGDAVNYIEEQIYDRLLASLNQIDAAGRQARARKKRAEAGKANRPSGSPPKPIPLQRNEKSPAHGTRQRPHP